MRVLKKQWIKDKRVAKDNGKTPPPEPDYSASTQKNKFLEKMIIVFTQLIKHVEDSIHLCEEIYEVDMQEVRSLISAMYGAHVEGDDEEEEY